MSRLIISDRAGFAAQLAQDFACEEFGGLRVVVVVVVFVVVVVVVAAAAAVPKMHDSLSTTLVRDLGKGNVVLAIYVYILFISDLRGLLLQ